MNKIIIIYHKECVYIYDFPYATVEEGIEDLLKHTNILDFDILDTLLDTETYRNLYYASYQIENSKH